MNEKDTARLKEIENSINELKKQHLETTDPKEKSDLDYDIYHLDVDKRAILREQPRDLDYWLNMDSWKLWEALELLIGRTPTSEQRSSFRENYDEAEDHWVIDYVYFTKTDGMFTEDILDLLHRVKISKSIKLIEEKKEESLLSVVKPVDFVLWASRKKIPIPEKMIEIMSVDKDGNEPEPLSAKEKRDLGTLRQFKENRKDMIKAAVLATLLCMEKPQEIPKNDLKHMLQEEGLDFTNDDFNEICKCIPNKFRKGPGAPKKK
ncbi:MAG TPA: hypothetical protein ENH10_10050 [Bacteroidetes bacterium]|nr:hypothetical protein BMS3Bbin04_00064 [bacterium BMS3Bbin04]HDO66348.1 hypothetical protein [Bacteroidota bacterium]HEX05473.1 hypothetical protein [Bacteroidota bacterium]